MINFSMSPHSIWSYCGVFFDWAVVLRVDGTINCVETKCRWWAVQQSAVNDCGQTQLNLNTKHNHGGILCIKCGNTGILWAI